MSDGFSLCFDCVNTDCTVSASGCVGCSDYIPPSDAAFEGFSSDCVCSKCLCMSCRNPDCEHSACDAAIAYDVGCCTVVCAGYETHGHYYYNDDGDEYWIGEDNRRHYTRDDG